MPNFGSTFCKSVIEPFYYNLPEFIVFAFKRMTGVYEKLADVLISRRCCNFAQILKFTTFYDIIMQSVDEKNRYPKYFL